MTYPVFLRTIMDAVLAKGCPTCGGGGKIGSQNRDCPACNGSGKSAAESRGR